ncbi:hypothetical protein NA57DRAFT_41132 [Rhizodiscina lignyota]|uniref:Uncharacterized protein n=1 Tax=Rhizodiscina lignyota TaxID=1504668 RepID=A0A9P4I9M4_9PEZI|nr:hypothetical protein NA57DRAFT_41132 [Rhizodiscina lignyota]
MPGQFLELTAPSPPSTCSSPCCSRRSSPARPAPLPIPLLDLLSNSLILHHTAPHVPVASLFALARTNSRFHTLLFSSPDTLRYLDLSTCKSANAAADIAPIDIGGNAWRSQRMDEALTEDEFYSGPLLGIFNRLASPRNNNILATVSTLILDGLTVPTDLVREIIAEDRFNVRILSIREVKHLNERKLRQLLRYAVRPGRPEGTPRLKGLYVFGPKDAKPPPPVLLDRSATSSQYQTPWPTQSSSNSVMRAQGAQLGAEWNARSAAALEQGQGEKWYSGSGRVLKKARHKATEWAEWAELIAACEGIIAFDAVLCRGPRHDVSMTVTAGGPVAAPGQAATQGYLPPAIATVSLKGCAECGDCVEGGAVFGECRRSEIPLLAPVPLHASTVRAAQIPSTGVSEAPRFIARCEDCLRSRWCERCNVWWDESCYAAPMGQERVGIEIYQAWRKSFWDQMWLTFCFLKRQMGSKRECFGCGPTCAECSSYYSRICKICGTGYCLVDNEGSNLERCDWCNSGARRRTRELY